MKKGNILIVFIFTTVFFLTGCMNDGFDSVQMDFKSLYLEATNDLFYFGDEDKTETIEISTKLKEEERAKKIIRLKEIISNMEEIAESEKQKRILADYRDFYEALIQIQGYTIPDAKCSVEEMVERNSRKILISMGRQEAKGESTTKY